MPFYLKPRAGRRTLLCARFLIITFYFNNKPGAFRNISGQDFRESVIADADG
jgi:hypothetical protein